MKLNRNLKMLRVGNTQNEAITITLFQSGLRTGNLVSVVLPSQSLG